MDTIFKRHKLPYLFTLCAIVMMLSITSSWITKNHTMIIAETAFSEQGDINEETTRDLTKKKGILNSAQRRNDFTNPDKWMILLTVNKAYLVFLRNWWIHFSKLEIKVNITVIAEDDLAFEELQEQYKYHYVTVIRSWILNISSELNFDSPEYNRMVGTRPKDILKYLEDNVTNVLYSDVDAVWLKSPFPYFAGVFDIWSQTESNAQRKCAGFMAIKNSKKTRDIMTQWISALDRRLQRNQMSFNKIVQTSNATVANLDERKFIAGNKFSKLTKTLRWKVVVLHANFCFGYKSKINCYKNGISGDSKVTKSRRVVYGLKI